MKQLYYVDNPNHHGIILRRTRPRLQEVIDRAEEIFPLIVPGAYWHETEKRIMLPAGGYVAMGHAEHEDSILAYKSFQFNLVSFDELTEFLKWHLQYMFTRNRAAGPDLPLQILNATNPGGEGMQWVAQRYVDKLLPYRVYKVTSRLDDGRETSFTRQFIPSTVFDNPQLPDRDAYIAGMADLDPDDREQQLYGRWGTIKGQFFRRLPREVPHGIRVGEEFYVIRAMDYGWTDPLCLLWAVVYPEHKPRALVELCAEIYHPKLTTDGIAQMASVIEADLQLARHVRYSVISPNVQRQGTDGKKGIITLLSEKGLWFEKANNNRLDGWLQLQTLIANGQLRMWEGTCPNLARTLLRLPKHKTRPNDVEDKKVEDHAAEAARYLCMAFHDAPELPPPPPTAPISERQDPFWERLQEKLADGPTGEYVEGLGPGF
jgi:phage terminase large subunit